MAPIVLSKRLAQFPSTELPKRSHVDLPPSWDVICFSHLRWDFVYQRPQHLLTRFAARHRVFFIEEPLFQEEEVSTLRLSRRKNGICVVTPLLPKTNVSDADILLKRLISQLMISERIQKFIAWYYTPMAIEFTHHLHPHLTVYDCMDELSAFHQAPRELVERERELMSRADVIFTGGYSLYEAKRVHHPHVYPFPSSIDRAHFQQARLPQEEPLDQACIGFPRIGFAGVIDERMDIELLRQLAEARPDWQWVLLGPIVKIDPATLPHRTNIHYFGQKTYEELPRYMAGWQVAFLPFARNAATRFISPTKTPEYLAAGRPVISTSIPDVVRIYERRGLVHVADTAESFINAAQRIMMNAPLRADLLRRSDAFLSNHSWDQTWRDMCLCLMSAMERKAFVGR